MFHKTYFKYVSYTSAVHVSCDFRFTRRTLTIFKPALHTRRSKRVLYPLATSPSHLWIRGSRLGRSPSRMPQRTSVESECSRSAVRSCLKHDRAAREETKGVISAQHTAARCDQGKQQLPNILPARTYPVVSTAADAASTTPHHAAISLAWCTAVALL